MKNSPIDPRLQQRLAEAEVRLQELDAELSDPAVSGDPDRLRTLGQERAEVEPVVGVGKELARVAEELGQARVLVEESDDPEMKELAEEEVEALQQELEALTQKAKELLVPKDPLEDRPAVVEILLYKSRSIILFLLRLFGFRCSA